MEEDDVSVRVAVRIRPQIAREIIDMCQICTSVTPREPQVQLGSDRLFTYDYVFDTLDTQELVYSTCVEPLVNLSLEGYNATVLAYGQTGSGKTYTMGSGFDVDLSPDQIGIIPRSIRQFFNRIEEVAEEANTMGTIRPEFSFTTQFMELYNEEIIDLYNPVYSKNNLHKIHEDPHGGIQIKGVTSQKVSSAEEALRCLRVGALSRTTASTQMNTQSSRSHAIFTIHVTQRRLVTSADPDDPDEFETLYAKFHFVDLAGSERLKRTGSTGERAKEGISINCGLLALGNVISALGDKSKRALHIPYRDSKLTRLLQDSLGGNSRTVMIACISPSDRDFMETLNTLRYANRARNIKNKVFINQDKSARTIIHLKQQIAQLQLELIEYKQGKRIVNQDGDESINDMFYENNMLQSEVNNLRIRAKALQETVENLTLKNTRLLSEQAVGNWGSPDNNHVTDLVQQYIQEIEDLRSKLMEANHTCDHLRKHIQRLQEKAQARRGSIDEEIPMLLEEAKRKLERERDVLSRSLSLKEIELNSDNSDEESEGEGEEKEYTKELREQLVSLTSNIDMKQKLVDELELSQRRMQAMKQHYEEKLAQLQTKIKSTQDERDKVLQNYSAHPEQSESTKKIKDEYSRKLADMQKELKRLQVAQKEHARLLRTHNQHENQLKSYKNELLELKQAKVKLINKMKDETHRHKEMELRRVKEIAQLRKESRKHENLIKNMEAEKRISEQVLKRKREEVSLLRKIQRAKSNARPDNRVKFSERAANLKWRKVENSINNIAINKRDIIEQEVRMENFLEKRETLGKELESLEERRKQAMKNCENTSELDDYVEDIKENLNYLQEKISETQQNVMEIEDNQDSNEAMNIQEIVNSVDNVDEAKYLITKLFNMTLSNSHAVAQSEAKLKENETVLKEPQPTPEEKLTALVLSHKELHDPSSPRYNSYFWAESSWREIAREMKWTVTRCKARWISIKYSQPESPRMTPKEKQRTSVVKDRNVKSYDSALRFFLGLAARVKILPERIQVKIADEVLAVVDAADVKRKSSSRMLKQENLVKGQLLDHVLHSEHLSLSTTALSSSSHTNTTSNNTSRSGSPVDSQCNLDGVVAQSRSKVRRRMAAPAEMLFGLHLNNSQTKLNMEQHRGPSTTTSKFGSRAKKILVFFVLVYVIPLCIIVNFNC